MEPFQYLTLKQIVANDCYPFSLGQMRMLMLYRRRNGLNKAVRKIGKCLFIRRDLFEEWIEFHGEVKELNKDPNAPHCITFCPDGENWAMEIRNDGIFFNIEGFPEWQPDDFAKAIIELLEKSFTVHFEKIPPCVRVDI